MNRVYRDKMDRVRLSAPGKRALIAALTEPAQKAAPRRVIRAGLVAALVAGALLISVGAAAVAVPVLQRYFSTSADFAYQKNSQILNKSQMVDGWTLTLTDCIGDDRFLYIGIKLSAPEGYVLDKKGGSVGGLGVKDLENGFCPGYELSTQIITEDGTEAPMGWYCNQIPDENNADHQLSFVLWVNCREPLDGKRISLEIGPLYHADADGNEVFDFEGRWQFAPLLLDLADQTIRLQPNQTVPVLDTTATLTELSVSPLSITALFKGEGLVGQQERYPNGFNTADPTIILYDRQGEAMPLESEYAPFGSRGGSGCDNSTGELQIVQAYETFIDLDALGAIEIDGVPIYLPERPKAP